VGSFIYEILEYENNWWNMEESTVRQHLLYLKDIDFVYFVVACVFQASMCESCRIRFY
jgi:hypothetical protein